MAAVKVKGLHVIQEDKDITGLIHLLDTRQLMHSLQQELPEITIQTLDKQYIRYKPGTSLLVRYRMQTTAGSYDIYAKSYNPLRSKLSNSKKRKIVPVIGNTGHIILSQHCIEIYLSPNDARLRSIKRLQNNKQRYSLLRKILLNNSGNKGVRNASIATLQYKPERRYVACLTTAKGNKAVLKAYRTRAYKQTLAHITQLDALGIQRFSPLIGHHEKYHILIFKWRKGKPLSEYWQDPDFNSALLKKLAKQLAKFHQGHWQQVVEPRKNNLSAILQGLAHLTPHLYTAAQQLVEQLQDQLQQIPEYKVRCHGDFYAKQILCRKNKLYWLDLDDICLAHPGRDTGTFIAHLEWDVVRGCLIPRQAAHYEHVFMTAYQKYSKQVLEPHHLNTQVALHLFQLIHHPFRNCETNWVKQTEELLSRIQQRLQQGAKKCEPRSAVIYPFRTIQTCIHNPFTLNNDATLNQLLQRAIDPSQCLRWFEKYLPEHEVDVLESIRVLRYKPGKRVLLEYHLLTKTGKLVLLGKIRAKGLHRSVYRINQQLYEKCNTLFADSGWQVPQPVCMIPECQMWLQQHVPGSEFTRLITSGQSEELATSIATMCHSLHNSGISVEKSHGVVQELAILKQQLYRVAEQRPQWKSGIHELYSLLNHYSKPLLNRPYCCIHRDFYPDQVIVDQQQLYLLDLDLFCMGDPHLDIGNFIAHIQEQALREQGDLLAYQSITEKLSHHYLQLTGQGADAEAIEIYQLLSLARHIAISQRLPDRTHLTPILLELTLQQVKK